MTAVPQFSPSEEDLQPSLIAQTSTIMSSIAIEIPVCQAIVINEALTSFILVSTVPPAGQSPPPQSIALDLLDSTPAIAIPIAKTLHHCFSNTAPQPPHTSWVN